MDMRVAGYQMPVNDDIAGNTQKMISAIDWAAENNAEILLTPEGALSGYSIEFDVAAFEKALEQVTRHAREKGVGLALGICSLEKDGKFYNQLRFYRPDGEYLGFHSKILHCGDVDDGTEGEHNEYASKELRTFQWRDDLCIGGLICNDMWANPEYTPMPDPHLLQQLSAMGAKVVFHAVHGGRDGGDWSKLTRQYHEANLRMRARAGKIGVTTVDNSNPETVPCCAPSGVINPEGNFVYKTDPTGAQMFVHTIQLTEK